MRHQNATGNIVGSEALKTNHPRFCVSFDFPVTASREPYRKLRPTAGTITMQLRDKLVSRGGTESKQQHGF